MLIPALLSYGFSKGTILLIVCPFSFFDMLGGYIGWSGFRGLVERGFKDDITFLQKVRGEEKTQDFIEWLKIYFARKYLSLLNDTDNKYNIPAPKRWLLDHFDSVFKGMVIAVKSGSYLSMIIFGLLPIPGSRMIPDIFCGTTRWKKGFVVLSVSNFLRIVAFVYGWNWVFS